MIWPIKSLMKWAEATSTSQRMLDRSSLHERGMTSDLLSAIQDQASHGFSSLQLNSVRQRINGTGKVMPWLQHLVIFCRLQGSVNCGFPRQTFASFYTWWFANNKWMNSNLSLSCHVNINVSHVWKAKFQYKLRVSKETTQMTYV